MRHTWAMVEEETGAVDETSDEIGLFFLLPLLAKPVAKAVKSFQQMKKLRKTAAKEVRKQARAVKAAESAPATTPVDPGAERAKLATAQAKLSAASQAEARARVDLIQAKTKVTPAAPPVRGVVIGNIYRPRSAGLGTR